MACPYCHTTAALPVRIGAVAVLRCTACGLPRPPTVVATTAQVDLVQTHYDRAQVVESRPPFDAARFVPELEVLRRLKPDLGAGSRSLDVGCSAGDFVEAMTHAGVTASGIDPYRRGVDDGRARGLDLHVGQFTRARALELFSPASFDIISIREAIYYMTDLAETFATARDLLKPNGIFYIKSLLLDSPYFAAGPDRIGRYGAFAISLPTGPWLEATLAKEGFVLRHRVRHWLPPQRLVERLALRFAHRLPPAWPEHVRGWFARPDRLLLFAIWS